MAHRREEYRRIRAEYETKAVRAWEAADRKRKEMHKCLPALAEIDRKLERTGTEILSALQGGGDVASALVAVRSENERLQAERAALLIENGYPADCTDVQYECKLCNDSGFVGMKMCDCMHRAIVRAGYAYSGLSSLFERQSFETFSLSYYDTDPETAERAADILRKCRSYAENFSADTTTNLLFMGGTGLGKTHLSTSIAKVLIERGFDVVYETAQNLFEAYQKERFGRSFGDSSPSLTEKYKEADLLIIDDLGSELPNQFTVSCLYNLLNTRINSEKPMLINTNLTQKELLGTYDERITSRLCGEFHLLFFSGRDIRLQKLSR